MPLQDPVQIDVSIVQWIEGALCVDCCPSRDEVEALHARVQACYDGHRDPELEGDLVEDTLKALEGGWLQLYELRAIQQLRGWHRLRYGSITVPRDRLEAVSDVLGYLLVNALDSECDDTLKDLDLYRIGPPPRHSVPDRYWAAHVRERASVLKLMTEREMCGECTWCQVTRLRDQCDDILKKG